MNINQAKTIVRPWISLGQWTAILSLLRGEEKAFYEKKVIELAETINSIPTTYSTDEKCYIRYHKNSTEALIMENGDWSDEEDLPDQAYGKSNFGHGWVLGNISILELIRQNYQLDLNYKYVPET